MAAYAKVSDVQLRMGRPLSASEQERCQVLLEDAAAIIDAAASRAAGEAKKVASCRMVIRALGDGTDMGVPIGATRGSMSALGYSQSWTASGGTGELYLSKTDRQLLGAGNSIGAKSPLEALCVAREAECL